VSDAPTPAGGSDAPPVGEEIHLPGPSFVPLANALGLAIAIIGLALGFPITVVGLIIFFGSLVRWVRETRHEVNELPR
jgi:hypothetical protein